MNICYVDELDGIRPEQMQGFFVGWPDPPSPQTLYRVLLNSTQIVLAIAGESGRVIGFVNALSDGVMSAYLPLLEVLPEYQGRGIGRELVRRMLQKLEGLYAVDLACDEALVPFYERFGFRPGRAMLLRDYPNQSGRG